MKRLLTWAACLAALTLPLTASGQSCAKLQADKRQLNGEYEQLGIKMRLAKFVSDSMTAALNEQDLAATGYPTWEEAKVAALGLVTHWQKLESERLALEERANKLEMAFFRAGCNW